jgi:hypothetical protein
MTQPHNLAQLPQSIGPIEAETRLQAIASIRAYADWLAANPAVPVPHHLQGTVHPGGGKLDRPTSIALAEHLIEHHNGSRQSGGTSRWSSAKVDTGGPVNVTHTIFVLEKPGTGDDTW